MYLLGHVASAILIYFIYEQVSHTRNDQFKLLIAVGSMLPDFLDKPVGSLFFHSGRWLGHSLIFQLFVYLGLISLSKIQDNPTMFRKQSTVLFLGALLHLIGDSQSITATTILWPFFGPFPTGPSNGFLFGFTHVTTIIEEIAGFVIICSIGLYEQWPKKYWFLFGVVVILYLLLFVVIYAILVGF